MVLGMDTMVMNNDEAEAREGSQPTYKKVKGFQPLQLTWGAFLIDALFRGGKRNGLPPTKEVDTTQAEP